jgi:nitric oxide dioxygenase
MKGQGYQTGHTASRFIAILPRFRIFFFNTVRAPLFFAAETVYTMITDAQIQLVKRSWSRLQGIRPEIVADLFYTRLFDRHPALRRLFPDNMDAQYRKLMDMLSTIVMRLHQLQELSPEISAMAQRHRVYGVRDRHYRYVGEALLWTLAAGLGREWTPETEKAWTDCYQLLSATMQAAVSPEAG